MNTQTAAANRVTWVGFVVNLILTAFKLVPRVTDAHNLRTRRIGNDIAIDLHIRVGPDMHVSEAHTIASKIEADIQGRFGQSTFVSLHVEPQSGNGVATQ